MENGESAALPHISLPIIVEGRYDKAAIASMFSATVITTEGFGIFNDKERRALIKRLSERGIILLTDSDGGGKQIRRFITGLVPEDKLYQLYIPRIEGKEKRKRHGGKEGVLGVEGVGRDVLYPLLLPFVSGEAVRRSDITPSLLYSLGLTGGTGAQNMRDALCERLGLPSGMSAKAFAKAAEVITDGEELSRLAREISQ